MSDIGILSGPYDMLIIAMMFGAPGLPAGAIIGGLLWRAHWIVGAAIGAVLGFAACLGGMWIYVVY